MLVSQLLSDIPIRKALRFGLIVLVLAWGRQCDGDTGRKNIALHKPYAFRTQPNYAHCTDPGDATDLTDGSYTKGYFWTQKGAVGWGTRGNMVSIIVDLGSDQPIGGAAFNTAAGTAGVTFPESMLLSVSTDGETFYLAGDIVQLSEVKTPSPEDGYKVVKFSTNALKTHGRYVQFTPLTQGMFVFLDEVEVYQGKPQHIDVQYNQSDTIDFENLLFSQRCVKRLNNHISALASMTSAARIPRIQKQAIRDRLKALSTEALQYRPKAPAEGFTLIMPYDPQQRDVIAAHSLLLRAQGFEPLTIWHKDRYAPLSVFETPNRQQALPTVRMMQNEYRADVLNLTNATDEEMVVDFTLVGVPGNVDVRQVEYVDTRELVVTATALREVRKEAGAHTTTIPAGMTRQIWFTVYSEGVAPGRYDGNVVVQSPHGEFSVPLAVDVAGVRFPDKPRLKAGVWDYAINNGYGISPQNREYALRDLREHFINVAFGNRSLMGVPPASAFDSSGRMLQHPDFSKFDEWLTLWPDAEVYHIFCAVKDKNSSFAGLKTDDPRFKTAISSWAQAWDEHARNKGLRAGQVQMHFIDEPKSQEEYQVLEQWAEAFKAGAEHIHVFNTPEDLHKDDNLKHAISALRHVDVLCPTLKRYRSYDSSIIKALDGLRSSGSELWLYMCYGPSRHYDPSYYRLQPWYCFNYGATGSFFWSYGDQRCVNPWNEYDAYGGHSFAVVYLTKDEITPTKHWEALREGIEDYEYLAMLRDVVDGGVADRIDPNLASDAKRLLTRSLRDIVAKVNARTNNKSDVVWMQDTPCIDAERVRLLVLDMLIAANKNAQHPN